MARLFLFLSLFYSANLFAQEVVSKLSEVRIFRSGAILHREATVQLKGGEQTLLFTKLNEGLNPNTLQLFTEGNIEILGFEKITRNLEELEKPQSYLDLKSDLEAIKEQRLDLDNQKQVIKAEMDLLAKNQSIGGNSGYQLEDLRNISNYIKLRVKENLSARRAIDQKDTELQEKQQNLEKELRQAEEKLLSLKAALKVKVRAPKAVEAQIGFSYSSWANIYWNPIYRLKFSGLENDLHLEQVAEVYQNTGQDWSDVHLVLSTGSPSSNRQLPSLRKNYIDLYELSPSFISGVKADAALNEVAMEAPVKRKSLKMANQSAVESTETRIDIKVDGPHDLANDKSKNIALQSSSLPAEYQYESVAKLNPSVFLVAKVDPSKTRHLIPGKVSIFNQGAFYGDFFSSFKTTDEKLSISLGKDPGFTINYERLYGENSENLFGSQTTELHHYRIKIVHDKSKPVKLKLYDQIPLSKNEDLKVKVIDLAGADLDAESGFLSWDLELPAESSKEIEFKYELKYPSDMQIR